MKSLGKLVKDKTIFFCCDIQTNFMPLIHNVDTVKIIGTQMAKASNVLNIPVVVTEQYSKYFGNTIPEIKKELSQNSKIFEKKKFSMITDEVLKEIKSYNRNQAILYGIEAHVCVLQTALDLLENDFQVTLVADGISSQRQFDKTVAFQRMMQSGVFVSSYESILFQLIQTADYEKFKDISKLCQIKDRPHQGELF